MVFDPEECERHGVDVIKFYETCLTRFRTDIEALYWSETDVMWTSLKALAQGGYQEAQGLIVFAKKLLPPAILAAWTTEENQVFELFMASEYLHYKASSDEVQTVSLKRCANEFLPHRSLRQCWKHFFDEKYNERIVSLSFPDLDVSVGPQLRPRRKTVDESPRYGKLLVLLLFSLCSIGY